MLQTYFLFRSRKELLWIDAFTTPSNWRVSPSITLTYIPLQLNTHSIHRNTNSDNNLKTFSRNKALGQKGIKQHSEERDLERCHSLQLRDFFPWSKYILASSWCYSLGPFYLRGLQNPSPEKLQDSLEVQHLHRIWQGIKYGEMCVIRQGSEIVIALFERSKPVRVLANRVTGIGICSY